MSNIGLNQLIAHAQSRTDSPENDLWPHIQTCIDLDDKAPSSAPVTTTLLRFLTGLSIAALLFAVLFIFDKAVDSSLPISQAIASIDGVYAEQKTALITRYSGTQAYTDNWQEQLNDLDNASEVVRQALKASPNNHHLLKTLKNIHEKQISIIERVHPKTTKVKKHSN